MTDPTFATVKRSLCLRWALGMSYQDIGKEFDNVNKGIIWNIINKNLEPKDQDIRAKLGLPTLAPVSFVETVSVHGKDVQVQAHTIKRCECGQHYIPNTGKRDKCFGCVKFRRRKYD